MRIGYRDDFRYVFNGQINHVRGVRIVLMRNMTGFVLLSDKDIKGSL